MWRLSICLFLVLLGIRSTVFAQEGKIVSGTYIYVIPETQSLAQARETAVQRAKMQILADTFGTVMDISSMTSIGNDGTQVHALSNSQVKGEWISTIGEPVISRLYDGDQLALKVEIRGKVREIIQATSEFNAKTLKTPGRSYVSDNFHNGESIYLLFQSPGDGFLTVYLFDGADNVYCLLPYPSQSIGVFPVKGGKEYILFSPDVADGVTHDNDMMQYTVQTSSELEINRLYVIYSPNNFARAIDHMSESGLRILNFDGFQRWLSKVRSEDRFLGVKVIDITIAK